MERPTSIPEATQGTLTPPLKWAEMTRDEKLVYAAKLAVCIISFGFIFPRIAQE